VETASNNAPKEIAGERSTFCLEAEKYFSPAECVNEPAEPKYFAVIVPFAFFAVVTFVSGGPRFIVFCFLRFKVRGQWFWVLGLANPGDKIDFNFRIVDKLKRLPSGI
jgi:hypothetical protein